MSDENPTAKDTARQARRLERDANNMRVPFEKRHESHKQAEALRAGQGV